MTPEDRERLSRMEDIATLKSDRALAELARATAACNRLKAKIDALDVEVSQVLASAHDPLSLRVASAFVALKRDHRGAVLAELAREERKRKACVTQAQKEEGRRIAVARLSDQAS